MLNIGNFPVGLPHITVGELLPVCTERGSVEQPRGDWDHHTRKYSKKKL